MEEPVSPRMVNNVSFENDSMAEIILNKAGTALDSIKERLGKSKINVGDALLDFTNYNEQNNYELTQRFCLIFSMLYNAKDRLNEIAPREEGEPSIYDALNNRIIGIYNDKLG
jgi:hypothetical protein